MLTTMIDLLTRAEGEGYAVGGFNVYNLEGVQAVVRAAERERSPAILQVHPAAFKHGGIPLIALCLSAAHEASVPIGVHLDHATSDADIERALKAGVTSVMADGSHNNYSANVTFTRRIVELARHFEVGVEAELGRLSGTEDDLTVAEYEARLTDPTDAATFIEATGISALAVCIGNVHGRYDSEPHLDLERLREIRARVSIPLVLHGASGLPPNIVQSCIAEGVRKFNVNTEVRDAYGAALRQHLTEQPNADLLNLMNAAVEAMEVVIVEKLRLFGSADKA